jgi:hypothetical protein
LLPLLLKNKRKLMISPCCLCICLGLSICLPEERQIYPCV